MKGSTGAEGKEGAPEKKAWCNGLKAKKARKAMPVKKACRLDWV